MKESETFAKKPANPFPGISPEEAARVDANARHVDGFKGPIAVCSRYAPS